ncbi:MAG: group II truncated hemoglobin [Deltaproteobacteria bacterium]|nr:group II truncated hemoglobin [Deltaproteobacteria bacterium]MBW2396758.1 group II truncated hemoglobin [Deltaproteobacteria bacterium]
MTEPELDPYQELGGADGVRLLVDHFYAVMDRLPEAEGIRAMHAPDLAPMRGLLFDFLSGWLGGPPLYLERTDRKCMRSAHEPFTIGPAEREAWLECMDLAMEEVGVEAELREILHQAFSRVAAAL